MGQAKLEISSNLQNLLDGLERVKVSTQNIVDETAKYAEKTKQAFEKPVSDIKLLNSRIKEQEKLLKEVRQEELRLWAASEKGQAGAHKDWERAKNDIKQYEKELSELKGRQAGLNGEATKGSAIFKKLGAAIVATFTVGAIVSFTKASVAAYQEQIRSEAKLRTALKGQEDAIGRLIKQGNELQKVTLFNDEEIINAQGLIAIYVKEEEQIKKLTPLILDFAQAKGMDLASAANIIGKTFGSSTNALTRYGIEVNGVASSTQRFDDIMQGLTKTVQGQAEGALTDEEKALRSMTVSVNETKEAWGKFALTLLSSVFADDSSPTGRLTKNLDFRAWELKKMAEDSGSFGERIKKNFKWLFTSLRADYDAEQMEKMFEQMSAGKTTLKDIAQVKTGNFVTPGAMNEAYDPFSSSIPKEIESLDLLKAKLKELKDEQSASPLEKFATFQPEIDALETQIALYEKKSETVKKTSKEIEKNLKTLADLERERMSAVIEAEIQTDIDLNAAREKNDEEYKQMRIDRMDWEIEQDAALYDKELKLLLDFQEKAKKAAEELAKFREDHPFAAMFGIENQEQLDQIKDYVGQLTDFANEIIDQQVQASERIVEDQNQRIDEQQALVDNELELKAEGLANSYELEKENLKKMQKARDEAIKDRERMIKIQRTMSTAESGIALVSAAANIIKGFSTIPIVGIVLGLAAVGAMIAGFILATSKAKDAAKMEHGGLADYGLLKGRRHSQGGIPINAEEGEFFVNRNSTAKHLPLLEAINRDDREGMRLYFDRKFINKFHTERNERDYTKHLKNIERNTRNKNSETIYGNGFIIERIGGYTKKINLN